MKPYPGTVEYAIEAYHNEMARAEAERVRKLLGIISEQA